MFTNNRSDHDGDHPGMVATGRSSNHHHEAGYSSNNQVADNYDGETEEVTLVLDEEPPE